MLVSKGRTPDAICTSLGGVAEGDGVYEISAAAGLILDALGGEQQDSGDFDARVTSDGDVRVTSDGDVRVTT